jgi:hypothetical protein
MDFTSVINQYGFGLAGNLPTFFSEQYWESKHTARVCHSVSKGLAGGLIIYSMGFVKLVGVGLICERSSCKGTLRIVRLPVILITPVKRMHLLTLGIW